MCQPSHQHLLQLVHGQAACERRLVRHLVVSMCVISTHASYVATNQSTVSSTNIASVRATVQMRS